METVRISETRRIYFYQTARRNIPEDKSFSYSEPEITPKNVIGAFRIHKNTKIW
jgi:hypothetical protein